MTHHISSRNHDDVDAADVEDGDGREADVVEEVNRNEVDDLVGAVGDLHAGDDDRGSDGNSDLVDGSDNDQEGTSDTDLPDPDFGDYVMVSEMSGSDTDDASDGDDDSE